MSHKSVEIASDANDPEAPGSVHRAVMTQEVMEALGPSAGKTYLDATLGGGTHSKEILRLSQPDGRLLSLDVDPSALARGLAESKAYGGRWQIAESNFRHLQHAAESIGWGAFDGILFDLGLSSDELEDESKGLSFQKDGPLDMRLGPQANEDGLTAATIVNRWSERDLRELLRTYGEERYASAIARALVKRRVSQPFGRTTDLADAIRASVPGSYAHGHLHPATKTFQALRIAVNDELASLKVALRDAFAMLAPGGTLVVISFHSLEDRIAKQTFKSYKNAAVSKKPIRPSADETLKNPRARSAVMRIARKTQIDDQNTRYDKTVRYRYD